MVTTIPKSLSPLGAQPGAREENIMGGETRGVPGLSDTAEHLLMDKEIKCCTPLVFAVDIFKPIGLSMLDKQNGEKAITEESSSSDCY